MSEPKPINNVNGEKEIFVIKKTKIGKSKLLTKTKLITINEKQETTFTNQVFRADILANMRSNIKLSGKGKDLFNLIMKENNELCDERRQGWIFESLCQILICLKCVENINYTEIYDGQLQNLKQTKNINSLLKVKVDGGGNNIVDMVIKQGNTLVLFTIKYKNKYSETDVSKIDNTITKQNITDDYKIGLFVKDKELVLNHKYKNKLNIDKQLLDKIIENGLLFDEKDVIKALDVFCQRFINNVLSIDEFIDFINTEYLLSPRQQLTKKLHQKMTELKFIKSFLTNKHKMWCIAHKPRSGKSILLLSICKYLLEHGYKKILIMTSVPATIHSFIKDLDIWIDFKDINYKLQGDFDTVDENFNGIVFCSVQYLKHGKSKKKDSLKRIGFDAIITDESHQGSSTDKTKTEIIDVDIDVEEVRKNIKLNIFASGTADKTKKYYGIPNSCIYEWEIEDESFMKEMVKPSVKNREDIIDYMVRRHGNAFTECLEDETLNKDYSKHPTQVLMKHSIPELLIKDINEYNAKYGTNFGYNCGSLFALSKSKKKQPEKDKNKNIIKTKNGDDFYDYEYNEEFELCKTTDGIELLKGFFDCIISTNQMRKSIMKQIEETQTSYGSRKSTIENPLLFIVYLPTHTRNNTINKLQKTFKQFLKEHKLWLDYNIEYSNSTEDTGFVKEEYNEYIQTIMNKTKTENKKGCILLLGGKGSVGITYKDCDATISLDDGHNLDNQKQRFSRALTEAEGKTLGINVDMNIQRTYMRLIDIIQKYRKNTKTTKTNAEILYYLFEHNIFLFDPQQINNGKLKTIEIMSYYQKEAGNIMKEIDDTPFLENLICDDDMRDILTNMLVEIKKQQKQIKKELEGEQQDCPKGGTTKVHVDAPNVENKTDEETAEENITEIVVEIINKTLELSKSLLPYLAMLSKAYKIYDFKEILISEKTKEFIISFLKDKKIELYKDNNNIFINTMNNIIDNNAEIINNIREIYSIAPANKLREFIEKHFIPTKDEKKQYAHVPSPIKLVDDMLNLPPLEFWKKPHKVFEPCCGKGNFVLGIFDMFYKGLEEMYPDEIERCRIIMTECIYYADITALNVFITTEIIKCHIQSYCGLEELDFEFNNYIGDTLELNVEDKWNINGFDAVIGNPPYQNSNNNKGSGNTLWNLFVDKSLSKWLIPNGLLLFVHPRGWRQIKSKIGNLMKSKQIVYLNMNSLQKGLETFKCATDYDYYLIENTSVYKNTNVNDYKNNEYEYAINSTIEFIPNHSLEAVYKLIDVVDDNWFMNDQSSYEPRKKWMSNTYSTEFKYPCVYSIDSKNKVSNKWSSRNDNGHFGITKFIFSNGNGCCKDINGDYGLTQWAYAIKCGKDDIDRVEKAYNSDKFSNIIDAINLTSNKYNYNIIKQFKRDFWKEFI